MSTAVAPPPPPLPVVAEADVAPVTPAKKRTRTPEQQREANRKRREREQARKEAAKALAAATPDGTVVGDAPLVPAPANGKGTKRSIDTEGAAAAAANGEVPLPPPKRTKKNNAAMVAADTPPLTRDGMHWAIGTKLKWPGGLDVTILVNDVFRTLVQLPPNTQYLDSKIVAQYRELLRLESDEDALFTWASENNDAFTAIVKLLQILTLPNAPRPKIDGTDIASKIAQKMAARGFVQAVALDKYVTKDASEYRALPALVQFANDVLGETEPRGGKAMHSYVTRADTTKNLAGFMQEFTTSHEKLENAQKEVVFVTSAFKALFY